MATVSADAFLTMQFDKSQMAFARKTFDSKQLQSAIRSAVGKTAREGRVIVRKEVQKKITIKTGPANEAIRSRIIDKPPSVTGVITVSSKPVDAFDFKASASKKRGARVQFWTGKPPARLRHAFEATMRSGHKGIFMRRKAKNKDGTWKKDWTHKITESGYAHRLPIDEVKGPSVYAMAKSARVNQAVMKTLGDSLYKNFNAQFSRFGYAPPN